MILQKGRGEIFEKKAQRQARHREQRRCGGPERLEERVHARRQ
jgi:hypothetical protein